ncbi:MAG: helix-turn-helix domain-containing protein [Myxococcota bacterium]
MATPNAFVADCPTRAIIARLAEKWTMLSLAALRGGPMRFGELRRQLEGISQKMLTKTLRRLEDDGLVVRQDYEEKPLRVEYSLTPLGEGISELVTKIKQWTETHMEELMSARRNNGFADETHLEHSSS